jgi:hypothetical protein
MWAWNNLPMDNPEIVYQAILAMVAGQASAQGRDSDTLAQDRSSIDSGPDIPYCMRFPATRSISGAELRLVIPITGDCAASH